MIRVYLYGRQVKTEEFLRERGIEGTLATGPWGKPFVRDTGIFFSKSDSGNATAFALSDEGDIGVDLQKVLPFAPRHERLAERFFTSEEARILSSLSPEKKTEYFFCLWTVKESFLKYTGRGLGGGLDSFRADLERCLILPVSGDEPLACFRILTGPEGFFLTVCAASLPESVPVLTDPLRL